METTRLIVINNTRGNCVIFQKLKRKCLTNDSPSNQHNVEHASSIIMQPFK